MNNVKIIEKLDVEREYGLAGVDVIAEHPEHGLLLVRDAFGGMGSPSGGAVRWRHGQVNRLQSGDSFEGLKNNDWNDYTSLFVAVINGFDDSRPILDLSTAAIARELL